MKPLSPPVFYYHSVAPTIFENWGFHFLTMPLPIFEDQLAYLQANRARTILLPEWLEFRNGNKKTTGKEVCLTFDDGFLDNWVYAYPLAKKYGMRFTLFVALECLDPREIVRPTLEDVWRGACREADLDARGYVSWQELKIMQESGVVDVQSHTMSHDKYIADEQLQGFYYGGANGIYPTWNAQPENKPFYLADLEFNRRLTWGTPLFTEKSAVIVRKKTIRPALLEEITTMTQLYDLQDNTQRIVFENVAKEVIANYQQKNIIIQNVESEADYQRRLEYEVVQSKTILEARLQKPVQFLCWPHGDNTAHAHAIARRSGYLATTAGKMTAENDQVDRIPRIGTPFSGNRWLSKEKFRYKFASHYHRQPYYTVWLGNELKNRLLRKQTVASV
jgi:hypothetical protein